MSNHERKAPAAVRVVKVGWSVFATVIFAAAAGTVGLGFGYAKGQELGANVERLRVDGEYEHARSLCRGNARVDAYPSQDADGSWSCIKINWAKKKFSHASIVGPANVVVSNTVDVSFE